DLGVSSLQLDLAQRGFSFGKEGPLDMRMNPRAGETVLEKISKTDEKELADILFRYGEERLSFKIARGILSRLKEGSLKTTLDLAEVAWNAYPPRVRHKRPHPATRTFQALRIWVNKEMQNLESFLNEAPHLLGAGGRVAVISYHSLEDRLVKHSFRKWAAGETFEILTKRPIVPTDEEVEKNPRARSAKLRGLLRCS
ncbi:MAG: 16S rRNA (cytosine(1402)-N(4))-methyltransferase RsmH, partial [bacterium]|nr:16S rRNA (cytosine(1402)-N(4))-methyltransferase RsmH [bacterium]